ncbi:clan AA aspartic protease [Myxacorys almedinensis]|uniref:Clan AA aspartic protease n=1 Tax=Myxacorys almedinensis A TaxID=2690445 RepID=A0A8J7YZ38_9CYAN|nr:clan AA aspartic protease [Myxacorys almedinensis A]
MIQGTVVGLQARISLVLRVAGRSDLEVECIVDTGFEGALTLPPAVIDHLDLPYLSEISANLADNTDVIANVYRATILWRGVERNIAVLAMGRRPLIGTALLADYHLSVDFYEGGSVIIDDIL